MKWEGGVFETKVEKKGEGGYHHWFVSKLWGFLFYIQYLLYMRGCKKGKSRTKSWNNAFVYC